MGAGRSPDFRNNSRREPVYLQSPGIKYYIILIIFLIRKARNMIQILIWDKRKVYVTHSYSSWNGGRRGVVEIRTSNYIFTPPLLHYCAPKAYLKTVPDPHSCSHRQHTPFFFLLLISVLHRLATNWKSMWFVICRTRSSSCRRRQNSRRYIIIAMSTTVPVSISTPTLPAFSFPGLTLSPSSTVRVSMFSI